MKTHKMSGTKLHRIWLGMRKRCYCKSHDSYHRYGGRGITICKRWEKFENFYLDMGHSYKSGLTLERIKNNKGYSPKNTKWGTWPEQVLNRCTSRMLTCEGLTMNLSLFARWSGTSDSTIENRIKAGWPIKEAIFAPKGTTLKIILRGDRLIMIYPDLAKEEHRHFPQQVLDYMEKQKPF